MVTRKQSPGREAERRTPSELVVSDHREIEDARRLELLIDAVVDYAIYMISLDGRVMSWNAGAERLKGYSEAEIIGQPFARFFTPEDQKRGLPQHALATAAKYGRFESEGWRIRKDGSQFWALAVLDAIRDETGQLIGFAKVTRDMTERRQAQQELIASEQRFRRLVESVVDYAIFQLDPNGIISTWNTGAARIKGYAADEIIGRHFRSFYTPEDVQAGVPEKALATARRDGKYEAEGWRVRKNGTRFWASVVIDAIRGDDGELIGFAKVTRDVTERMEAQRMLRQAQEQLAVSQKMEAIGQLSGGIAHDFNNLLMIVLGNLETIQRRTKDLGGSANVQRALNNAMRGAQRAAALTARLLAFSRRQPLNPRPLDVNKFLTGLVEFVQRSLGELIEIEAVGAAGIWQIEIDAAHLESALVNLAINSRDAMPRGGKLTIEAANVFIDEEYCRVNPELSPGQFVTICVSDTGTGMSKDVLDRAFEPFFTTKDMGQGTGLGLSQVYGFVKQSGGHIKLYSEPGQGTTVKMYFPRLVGRGDEEDDELSEPVEVGEQGETILVVEDDDDVREYLLDALRDLKYHVISASNADGALNILKRAAVRVDLLLTDVIMPGANGRELGRRAQQLRPSLKILYMTGYSRNAVVHQGRLDDGVEFIQKPMTQADLSARVRQILDGSPGRP
jgi:PAS domain S-box-containing protein